jgi:REP element-mobilizing transposase RayT
VDRYRVHKEEGCAYLCTCVFNRWLPIFLYGEAYLQIATKCLQFCREKKRLTLHGYVLMPDHLHLIVNHADPSALLRELKSWTSRQIRAQLERDGRQEALSLLNLGITEGQDGWRYSVWQRGFHPKAITSDAMMLQKLQYVHDNPVRKDFVAAAEEWRYSSAGFYVGRKGAVIEVDTLPPVSV